MGKKTEYEWTKLENHPITVVQLEGFLDKDEKLKPILDIVIHPDTEHVALIMDNVQYINSAGIGALIGVRAAITRRGNGLFLVNPTEAVGEVLDIMGVQDLLQVKKSLQEVIQAVEG